MVRSGIPNQVEPFRADGGPVGVLFCHGFTGSPASLLPWAQAVADAGFTVRLPRLPGHGTTVHAANRTAWPDWYDRVEREYVRLSQRCQQVFVFGLSMGGCLALRLAQVHNGRNGYVDDGNTNGTTATDFHSHHFDHSGHENNTNHSDTDAHVPHRSNTSHSSHISHGGHTSDGGRGGEFDLHGGRPVAGLVLVNPAVTVSDRRLVALPLIRRLAESSPGIGNDIAAPGVSEQGYDRVPHNALHSMLDMMKIVRADMPEVTAPVLLFRSVNDHVVGPQSAPLILGGVTSAAVRERLLTRSFHVATLDYEADEIAAESIEFLHTYAELPLASGAAGAGRGESP